MAKGKTEDPRTAALPVPPSPERFSNRELSWLGFARRVLALVEDREQPLLERLKFAGIMGMLHDEFFMKRMSGLKRQIDRGATKLSLDGRTPREEFDACRHELLDQVDILGKLFAADLRPALRAAGIPILDHDELSPPQRQHFSDYFRRSVQPALTPLAVDSEHPFPFISNLGLNLGAWIPRKRKQDRRFVRIKVPGNRPRWVPLPDGAGYVPLEQIIAANLDQVFPETPPDRVHCFRVTRGAEGNPERDAHLTDNGLASEPGSIVRQVTKELKARRFAGVVRLQVDPSMPQRELGWLTEQLHIGPQDVYVTAAFLGMSDLLHLDIPDRPELRYRPLVPVTPPRLVDLRDDASGIFDAIAGGDILLHHPYDSFDASVLRFLESAAVDPDVLAIKLTIYRTSRQSPIVRALVDAARRGKQVAVLVEITARFDEAPNIAWGRHLEEEGVHVAYGVESLKTHVKLALVVREERGEIRRYAHVGTGNYHTGTARLYEDVGLLTCDPQICDDVAAVFNELTGAVPFAAYSRLLVAPGSMRARFHELIRRETAHAAAGRPSGISAKMNQLQDPEMIEELYRASQAGVPISLNVRGLCCLKPGVRGVSETIRVFSVVGRFLEHSRIYRFENGGSPEFYIGSADWMRRNLASRIETIAPVLDPRACSELQRILDVYDSDNCSAWDCGPDGQYRRRAPAPGEARRSAQQVFIEQAARRGMADPTDLRDAPVDGAGPGAWADEGIEASSASES